MSCNSCAKSFTIFRKEKGCPGCGFSYCSNCLVNKIFVPKLNAEAKVCVKCSRTTNPNEQKRIDPPDAYYKRLGLTSNNEDTTGGNPHDQEIQERLQKLKQDKKTPKVTPEDEISKRLKDIKGEVPSTSDAELQLRLANLRGVPVSTVQSKPILLAQDLRTEQEQADDLLKQYMDQTKIDNQYQDEFDALVNDIESRVQKLKNSGSTVEKEKSLNETELEDEEETIRKIVEKVKAESSLEENEIDPVKNDELPFCEICNEDARMRCLGCRYLFCKRCFAEHKDDDYECNRYEPYEPPKGNEY